MAQVESMIPDLMGIVNRQLTPEVIRKMAARLGEDRDRTASAVSTSVPSVLTALSDVANSDTGAAHLKETVDETRHAAAHDPGDLGSFMQADATPTTTNGHGHSTTLIEDELGPRSSSIAEAVARTSGIKRDSARQILGGITSVAVVAIGKTVGGTGSASLRALLGAQRGEWVKSLPGPVASLFNGTTTASARSDRADYRSGHERARPVERLSTAPAIREIEAPRRWSAWLLPAILVALALLAIPFMRGMRRRPSVAPPATPQVTRTEPPAPRATTAAVRQAAPAVQQPTPAPAPVNPASAAGTDTIPSGTKALAAFLTGTEGTTPRRFAMAPLNFAFGSTKLTPGSMSTVDDVAGLLNETPGATIRLESFTDNVGTPEANQALSTARSDEIKSLLTSRGVDASRIEAAGMGQEQPAASNDTAEGRAQNRRTDVVVTGR